MKLKTSELTGKALAWSVGHCEGFDTRNTHAVHYALDHTMQDDPFVCMADDAQHAWEQCENAYPGCVLVAVNRIAPYDPTEPNVGVPILQREGIGVYRECQRYINKDYTWGVRPGTEWEAIAGIYSVGEHEAKEQGIKVKGPDMMTAGLRCYVASKYGEHIEVPDELCEVQT